MVTRVIIITNKIKSMLHIGDPMPAFSVIDDSGRTITEQDIKEKKTVL